MNIETTLNFPIELIKRALNGDDDLHLMELCIYAKGKLNSKRNVIYSNKSRQVSEHIGVPIPTFQKYLPSLIKHGLIRQDNKNTIFISPYKHYYFKKNIKQFWIDFDGCDTLQSFKERLILCVVKEKTDTISRSVRINQESSFKKRKQKRKLNRTDDIRKTVSEFESTNDGNENINSCIGLRSLSKNVGTSQSTLSRTLNREKLKGKVEVKEVVFKKRVGISTDSENAMLSRTSRYAYAYSFKGKIVYHYGSIINVPCIQSFHIKDWKTFFESKAFNRKLSVDRALSLISSYK